MTDNNADNQVDGPDNNHETVKIIVEKLKQRRNDVNQSSVPSMYRVPETLRDVSKNCYTPRIVSIGPFHEKDEHLKGGNVHKMSYVDNLLKRLLPKSPWDRSMKACVGKVLCNIVKIKACYEKEETKTYDDLIFAQMMVVDACFILEMIYRSDQKKHESHSFFDSNLLTLYVKHDLLLLENQIPFFVLVDIFKCTINKINPQSSLAKLVLTFMKDMNPFGIDLLLNDSTEQDHILGLVQKCYWNNENPNTSSELSKALSNSAEEFSKAISYSVTELAVAGVKFKPNKGPNCQLLEMKYISSRTPCFCWSSGKPTFRMPKLQIDGHTESVLRKIIEYEQSSSAVPSYMTSYAFAMERMLDTKEDIIKLIDSKVVINNLGSSEQASIMINNICKEVTVEEFIYINQWRQLETYYNGYWPKHIAWLRRTYFSTPWSFIALVAALVLFGLAVTQTFFTIRPA